MPNDEESNNRNSRMDLQEGFWPLFPVPSLKPSVKRWTGGLVSVSTILSALMPCYFTRPDPQLCECGQWRIICSRPWHVTLRDGTGAGGSCCSLSHSHWNPSSPHASQRNTKLTPNRDRKWIPEFAVKAAGKEMFHKACKYTAKATLGFVLFCFVVVFL